jgi:hypothetical protein
MDLRLRNLERLDSRAVQLPHGTEVVTRVDRVVGERRVPQGTIGRVTKMDGEQIDVTIEVRQQGDRRSVSWWPSFRVIDTAEVAPDPAVAAQVALFEEELGKEMNVALGTTAVELDSRNATVRSREAAIGNLVLQMRGLAAQRDAAKDAADAKFAALLTADQQVKFAAFTAAAEFLRQRGPGGPGGPPR